MGGSVSQPKERHEGKEAGSDNSTSHLLSLTQLGKGHNKYNRALTAAVERYDPDSTSELLKLGADVNVCDVTYYTPLMLAAQCGAADVLAVLIEKGACLDSRDSRGETALMKACRGQSQEGFRLLLEAGADVTIKDNKGQTVLAHILKRLLHTNAEHKIPMIKSLLDRDYGSATALSVFGDDLYVDPDGGLGNVLIWACDHDKVSLVRILVDIGIDLERQDRNQNTALFYAAEQSAEITRILVEKGADIEHRNSTMCTPITWAVKGNSHNALSVLVQAGASLNARDKQGRTAIMKACIDYNHRCCQVLLRAGADISLKDNQNLTALGLLLSADVGTNPSTLSYKVGTPNTLLGCFISTGVVSNSDLHLFILSQSKFLYLPCLIKNCRVLPTLESFTYTCLHNCLHSGLESLQDKPLTPFTCAVLTEKLHLARFFLSNWFLHSYDVTAQSRTFLSTMSRYKSSDPDFLYATTGQAAGAVRECPLAFLESVYSQPWSLQSLAFLQVSTQVGFGPDRYERVARCGLPASVQRRLRFESPDWGVESSQWDMLSLSCVHSGVRFA